MAHEHTDAPTEVTFDQCADVLVRRGHWKVGILGTKYTMTGPVYPGAFGRRRLAWAVPDEANRKIVDDIIFVVQVGGPTRAVIRSGFDSLALSSRKVRGAVLSGASDDVA